MKFITSLILHLTVDFGSRLWLNPEKQICLIKFDILTLHFGENNHPIIRCYESNFQVYSSHTCDHLSSATFHLMDCPSETRSVTQFDLDVWFEPPRLRTFQSQYLSKYIKNTPPLHLNMLTKPISRSGTVAELLFLAVTCGNGRGVDWRHSAKIIERPDSISDHHGCSEDNTRLDTPGRNKDGAARRLLLSAGKKKNGWTKLCSESRLQSTYSNHSSRAADRAHTSKCI